MKKNFFDVAIVGAGSGGLTTAVGLTKAGKRVLLIEQEHIGGECTNTGCIPSKALLHHAKSYWRSKHITGKTTAGESYRQGALSYVQSKISAILEHETPKHFSKMGITVIIGEAIFTSRHTILVGKTQYQFARAVIATGSSPRLIDIPGLDSSAVLTNQNIFSLTKLPEHLLIIGSGPIGLELGQAFAMLGSRITIATIDSEIGKLEDEAVRPHLIESCLDLGIQLEVNAHIKTIESNIALFDSKVNNLVTNSFRVPFDKILSAIGRVPNLPKGLHAAGVHATPQGITVDHNYRTTNRNIYALGDVADRLKFTHVADTVAKEVVKHIVSRGLLGVRMGTIPKVTYTEPEMAQVGLSWVEAVDAYGADRLYRLEIPLTKLDRAITDSATNGTLVVIAKRLSGKIIGAHMAGPRAGEIIALFTVAIDNRLSLWRLGRSTYAYPTYAQLLKLAATSFLATQLSNLKTDCLATIKRHLLKIVVLVVWLTVILAFFWYLASQDTTALSLATTLFSFITQSIWGPVLFIIANSLRPIAFLPATWTTILAGTFFGFWWGLLYTVIGANLGASLAYVIGRFFSKKTPGKTKTVSLLARFTTECQTKPFMSVLLMRLLFLPYDVVNYGAGILRLPYLPYICATIIGTFLGTAMFVSIGVSVNLEELIANGPSTDIISPLFLLLSFGIFLVSLFISRFVSARKATLGVV